MDSETDTALWHPYGHSLVRTMLHKQRMDERLEAMDKNEWYICDVSKLPSAVASTFLLLTRDGETETFMDLCREKSDWIFTQIFHALVKSLLSWFMTQTAINSLLRRGSMFVFSSRQFQHLLGSSCTWRGRFLLDVGAGDGNVTAVMAPLFRHVFVTEASPGMRSLLAERNYTVLGINEWADGKKTYDVITILNVLDRCDRPLTMLRDARRSLVSDTGRLVVALALPFSPYVEIGRKDHAPIEVLPITGSTFEQQVKSAIENVFVPEGFQVQSWSRVPYLCEGDLHQSFYWLFDAIFVLKVHTSSDDTCS